MHEDNAARTQGYDARAIGLRLRQVRKSRRMTLRVLAGLVGVSGAHLSHIENGLAALDSLKLLAALADTLRIAPSDLVSPPIPRPANSHTDTLIEAVHRALMAVADGLPGGEVQTVAQLRQRYTEVSDKKSDWHSRGVGLPGLIVDLHTTLEQRQEMDELLPLACLLHTEIALSWLYIARAPIELRWQPALLARHAAQELNEPTWLGLSGWCSSLVLLSGSAFDLARQRLDATSVPTDSSPGLQLNGMLALSRSLVSAADGHPAESSAALEHATELAARTGQRYTFQMGFGPINIGIWRVSAALECGDPDEAIRVAEGLDPQEHPYPQQRAAYWTDFGRALTQARRREDAARALLRAEKLQPTLVLRNPRVRESLVELVSRSKDDQLGRAIRAMAWRAGLPV
jgi:transcriptional regulator with XRE-family HTH domain